MNADNLVGRTVAGYHLTKYVGEGGTATVYRAEHPDRGVAAVKILRSRLARIRWPSSVSFGKPSTARESVTRTSYGAYDYGQADGLHYLALEWADGEPLAEFVADPATWPPRWSPRSSSRSATRSLPRTGPGSSIGI